jgi:hypothetical protein
LALPNLLLLLPRAWSPIVPCYSIWESGVGSPPWASTGFPIGQEYCGLSTCCVTDTHTWYRAHPTLE